VVVARPQSRGSLQAVARWRLLKVAGGYGARGGRRCVSQVQKHRLRARSKLVARVSFVLDVKMCGAEDLLEKAPGLEDP
jgi:hypothetical protein